MFGTLLGKSGCLVYRPLLAIFYFLLGLLGKKEGEQLKPADGASFGQFPLIQLWRSSNTPRQCSLTQKHTVHSVETICIHMGYYRN